MLNQEELAQLMEARHPDAFSVLGLRQRGPHWWLHALLPGASAVTLLAQPGGQAIAPPKALHALGDSGVWAVDLGPDTPPTNYRLQVCWPGPAGEPPVEQLLDDPYRFGLLLGELDLWLLAEGRHLRPWECLGAHPITLDGVAGTRFAVWAPNARHVSVVGDFNHWDGRRHPMRLRREAGLWELFLPGVAAGALYKFEVLGADGSRLQKADPFALRAELRPATASVVQGLPAHRPMAPERARANQFDQPVSEHPFDGSWGYQPIGLFAPTSRFGSPEDFQYFVDAAHAAGLGVILDWVPAHFPSDAHGLARFDGTHLYEYADPREGFHQDWNTLIYNFGRLEVRNFLVGNALYWLERFGIDGLRVDAVASMLYRDYSRPPGQWLPNRHGGRENLEAIEFLRWMNHTVGVQRPGAITLAEESTAFPGVS